MISPTERQADALTELVNIAFGLTAAKLTMAAVPYPLKPAASLTGKTKLLNRCFTKPAPARRAGLGW